MLFSSIVNNLTGADDGFYDYPTRLSWNSYPGLAQLLLRLLARGEKPDELTKQNEPQIGSDVQRVYLALDLLRRAGPPEDYENRILSQLVHNFDFADWQLREASAQLYGAILHNRKEWYGAIEKLLKSKTTSANESHGILLTVGFVLKYRLAAEVHRVSMLGKQLFLAMIVPNHFIYICQIMLLMLYRRLKAPSGLAL
jgi:hypothetical protein